LEASEEEDACAQALRACHTGESVASCDNTSQSSGNNASRSSKVDRRSLRAVKRNLLSCYDESHGNDSDAVMGTSRNLEESRSHASPSRGFADENEVLSAPRTRDSRRPLKATYSVAESPGFDNAFSGGASDAQAWADVDLSKWATVSKVAVSPVVRGTLASPMPVVLPHRVVHCQPTSAPASASARADEESSLAGSALLEDVDAADAHLDSALCASHAGGSKSASLDLLDLDDHPMIETPHLSGSRDHEAAAHLPPLRLPSTHMQRADYARTLAQTLTSVPESPGADFDSAAERDAQEGDAALLRIIIKVLSGARQATPLTSRYRGSDPELLSCTLESMQIETLAEACLKALPVSYTCTCEGRQLLDDFEELPLPLYETVAHSSADLMRFVYAKDTSLSDSSRENALAPCVYVCLCLCVFLVS
jgi:hypothetical protein